MSVHRSNNVDASVQHIGLLSSSVFKLITAHAKSDALLSNVAKAHPAAVAMATTHFTSSVATHFRRHEFQRAASYTQGARGADRRSLRGSWLLTLDSLVAMMKCSKPYYLRDTLQRPLCDASGAKYASFAESEPVRDQSKRGRMVDQCSEKDKVEAEKHWNMLSELLAAFERTQAEIEKKPKIPLQMDGDLQTVAKDASQLATTRHQECEPLYVEISPCQCELCRNRGINPNQKIRLLCFQFQPNLKVADIVAERKQKMRSATSKALINTRARAATNNNSKAVALLPNSIADDDLDPVVVSRVLSRLQQSMRSEIERAVDGATNHLRQELSQSNAKVRSLSDQVAWLSDQLALVQLGAAPADESVLDANERPLKRRLEASALDNSLEFSEDIVECNPLGIALSPPLSPMRLSACRAQVSAFEEWPNALFQQAPPSPTH